MKTVIIYNKYILTEDGKVFNSETNHEFKSNSKGLVRLNARQTISVRKHVLLHFNTFICIHCNKTVDTNINPVRKYDNCLHYVCNSCRRAQRRISAKRHYKNNPEMHKKFRRRQVEELTDSYVAGVMQGTVKALPTELIKAKRQQLKLHRNVGN